jgi:hypothetical protein
MEGRDAEAAIPALKSSVKLLNDPLHRNEAASIISKVYSHYDSKTPSQVYFN